MAMGTSSCNVFKSTLCPYLAITLLLSCLENEYQCWIWIFIHTGFYQQNRLIKCFTFHWTYMLSRELMTLDYGNLQAFLRCLSKCSATIRKKRLPISQGNDKPLSVPRWHQIESESFSRSDDYFHLYFLKSSTWLMLRRLHCFITVRLN